MFQFPNFFIQDPWILALIIVWSLVWRGLALWKAAHRNEKYWFIALLVINTVGLFELLYLFVITPWIDGRKKKMTL